MQKLEIPTRLANLFLGMLAAIYNPAGNKMGVKYLGISVAGMVDIFIATAEEIARQQKIKITPTNLLSKSRTSGIKNKMG